MNRLLLTRPRGATLVKHLLLAGGLLLGACKGAKPTVLEVNVPEATVWSSPNVSSHVVKRLPQGTRINTMTKLPAPGFYVVQTDNGEGIIRDSEVEVVTKP